MLEHWTPYQPELAKQYEEKGYWQKEVFRRSSTGSPNGSGTEKRWSGASSASPMVN